MAEIKIKMDKTTIILSSVVGSLGFLSTILGFAGISDPSPGLGISAGIFLLIAQITVTAVGGCCGCCASSRAFPSETKRIVGIVCAVGSWITSVIACLLFFLGAGWSGSMLAGAAVLTLIATALNITYVIMMQGQPPVADPEVALAADHKQPVDVHTKPRSTPIPVAQAVVPETTQNTAQPAPSSSPSAPLLHTNGQVPKSPESHPPPTAPDNRTNPQNQQFSPEGRRSSVDTAQPSPPEAQALKEPVHQSATRSVMMSQPPVTPAQTTHAPLQTNATPRHTVHQAPVQPAHVVGVPGTPSSATASAGNVPTLRSTTIGNELAKATIRFTEKAIERAVFGNNNTTTAPTTGGADILTMITDSTGAGDVGATDYGDSAAAY